MLSIAENRQELAEADLLDLRDAFPWRICTFKTEAQPFENDKTIKAKL